MELQHRLIGHEWLVHHLAPQTRFGWVLRSFLLLCGLISFGLLSLVVTGADLDRPLFHFALNVLVVAGPIVFAFLAGVRMLDRALSRARVMATSDPLTGLLNREAFVSRATQAAARGGILLILDVDGFRRLNEPMVMRPVIYA